MYKKIFLVFILIFIMLYTGANAESELKETLSNPEFVYEWQKGDEKEVDGGKVYELYLTSQVWQGLIWKHRIQIFYPHKLEYPQTCTILNLGGERDAKVDALGMMVAESSGTVFAVLWNIPNQPLFEGKWEDELVAYTWLKFMETGDKTWPLHFPMARAVIKCMDAVQEFILEEGLTPVDDFIITGASKRGWTTWLVGASEDERVRGIIPMVIDTLNIGEQFPHHLEAYGKPSEKIHDYTESGILDRLNTPEGQELIELVDPYSYRENIIMPKLIINSTNDRYWALDALNLYWDDLKGPKWLLYIPNSGHNMEDLFRVVSTSTAFINATAGDKTWPHIEWSYKEIDNGLDLFINSDIPPKMITLYKAHSSTKDFRSSKWTSEIIKDGEDDFSISLIKPEKGFNAYFCELTYEVHSRLFNLSTQIRIIGE